MNLSNGRFDVVSNDPFEERENSSENSGDSPPSTTVSFTSVSSPKRSRRAIHRRVVTVPIKEVEGGRFSKGGDFTTPPSDSWAWRKYGQKPIKGSPYPRGYYRCSSSKGCPARKQVERNRLNPTMLVITYSCDHNHSFPVTRNHGHHHHHHNSHHSTAVTTTRSPPTKPTTAAAAAAAAAAATNTPLPHDATTSKIKEADPTPIMNYNVIPNNNNFDQRSTPAGQTIVDATFTDLAGDESLITTDEFTWAAISNLDTSNSTSAPFSSSMYLGTGGSTDAELARYFPTREEDESDLFADLGELPECSFVFGRSMAAAAAAEEEEMRRRQCSLAAAPWCGSTR